MIVRWIIFFVVALGTVCGVGVMGRDAKNSSIVDRLYSAVVSAFLLMTTILLGISCYGA